LILLDTNICAAALRGERRVSARLLQHGGRIHLPWVVAAELKYGVEKLARSGRDVESLRARVTQFLSVVGGIVYARETTVDTYASLRAALDSKGEPIGANDLWIAALALSEDAVLVTDNLREFKRVPGLHLENWLVR